MNIGQLIHIIQIIVTIFCGAEMIMRPFGMRRESKWRQAVFYLLLTVWTGIAIANSFYFKASAVENMLALIYTTIIIFIFYKIPFLVLVVQNGLYWVNLSMAQNFLHTINGLNGEISVQKSGIEDGVWTPILLVGMCLIIVIVVALCVWKRKYRLFTDGYQKIYTMCLCILAIEYILRNIYFHRERLEDITNRQLILDNIYVAVFLILLVIIVIVLSLLRDARYRDSLLLNNNKTFIQQYEHIKDSMEIKRHQNHDMKQHLLLLRQYLKHNQVEAAMRYLDDIDGKQEIDKLHNYCQIPVIDYMLDEKIKIAQKYNIKVETELEVCFCPISDVDMCIIMGNLMDNAIEALQNVTIFEKVIKFSIKMVNDIFIMKVSNPYQGNRKKINDGYVTTKPNKKEHGLGIRSVKNIVEKNGGSMEISDKNEIFQATIIL